MSDLDFYLFLFAPTLITCGIYCCYLVIDLAR